MFLRSPFRIFILLVVLIVTLSLTTCMKAGSTKQTFEVKMRDGVTLATDVYIPSKPDKYPVVLMRTPYNKDCMKDMDKLSESMGYVIIVQDTRGRYASKGMNLPFDGDGWWGPYDGEDSVDWISSQNWCNGKIATFGGSALGIAQLMLTGTGTDKIACQHISVGCPGLYRDGITHGGVFRYAMMKDWVTENKFDEETLPLWKKHPTLDDYWKQRDLRYRFDKANIPAIHIGGWYDIFAQGTLDAFVGLQNKGGANAKGHQKLIMGPWTHAVGASPCGEITFPNSQNPPNKANDLIRQIEYYLKGIQTGEDKDPPVTYYVMGDTFDSKAPGNVWRTADTWPPVESTATPFYLKSNNTISRELPSKTGIMKYVCDPSDPVPTIGGPQLTLPAGPKNQQSIESRKDILVFTSEPMKEPMEITGKVNMLLWASTDAPDTDFIARLCVVYPDGRSFNICEGALRAKLRESLSKVSELEPGKPYLFNIDMWSTSIIINKGLRLRVHVSSSSFPAFAVNKNDGSTFGEGKNPRIAHNTVFTGGDYGSAIILPVVEKK